MCVAALQCGRLRSSVFDLHHHSVCDHFSFIPVFAARIYDVVWIQKCAGVFIGLVPHQIRGYLSHHKVLVRDAHFFCFVLFRSARFNRWLALFDSQFFFLFIISILNSCRMHTPSRNALAARVPFGSSTVTKVSPFCAASSTIHHTWRKPADWLHCRFYVFFVFCCCGHTPPSPRIRQSPCLAL